MVSGVLLLLPFSCARLLRRRAAALRAFTKAAARRQARMIACLLVLADPQGTDKVIIIAPHSECDTLLFALS